MDDKPLIQLPLTQKGTHMRTPTPGPSCRLILIVALLLLLAALAVPALAQEPAPDSQPLAAAPASPAAGESCSPLTKNQQETFDKLAQLKQAGALDDVGYDLFLKLGEQAACAATVAAPEGIEAVSTYAFAQTSGTYTPITGGSTLGTAGNDDQLFSNIAIGFSFNYDGTSYTTVGICSNGYIVMGLNTGSYCSTSYTPISSTAYNNLISALGSDLQGNPVTGELRYQTQGTAPNRTFTVQWTSYRKYIHAGDDFNFQIILYETSNVTEVKYGAFTANAFSSTPQVGIKGASNADFSNRTTTTDWSASTAGGSNTATMTLSSAVKPASGQTYTWALGVTSFPYTQNFDGVTAPTLPPGWTVADGSINSTRQWENASTPYARSAPNAMRIGWDSTYGMDDWFFSPPLQLTGGTPYQVTFYYRAASYHTQRMEVKWGTAPTVAGMTGGQIWDNPGFTNETYAQGTTSIFTPVSSGIYYVGWHGYSGANNWGMYVDDITVYAANTPPPCATGPSPADAATNVLINADLNWGAALNTTGYKVYFGTADPPTTLVSDQTGATYDPGAMAYLTTHYWQIVPYNTYSLATGCPIWSFTTEPDPTVASFPYTQHFDGPRMPSDWSVENTNGDYRTWGLVLYRRGLGAATGVQLNLSLAMNDWLFTPPLQLTGGVTYGVRFFYRAESATYPEKMDVWWGGANTSAAMTNGPIFTDAAIANTTMKEAIATFTPGSSGIYYVGFHGYSDANMRCLAVDDVTIYDTADSTWQWQGGASNDWGANANWEGDTVPGSLDTVKIPVVTEAPLANPPLVGSYSEPSYGPVTNLTVDPGATLELATTNSLKVLGAVTNNGMLKQTRNVALGSPTVFLHITDGATPPASKYFGVEINPTSTDMGNVTVTVGGNQQCAGVTNPTVKRCFTITPATQAAADITFYFTEAEMTPSGQPLANQQVWNYHTGAWNAVTRGTNSGACESGAINCFVQGTGIAAYSPFAVGPSVPLAVTLAEFEAAQVDDAILVTWETNSELNTRGFNLWRGTSPAGPDIRLNATLIPSQSQGNPGGFSYAWEDRANLVPGTTYFYWLEDVDLSGNVTRHGLASVTYINPLGVDLAAFAAEAQASQVLVTWETANELHNAGFNLFRAGSADGADRTLLAYVPSQSPGSAAGASYSYADASVAAGQTYWYWLSVTLDDPTAVTLSGMTAGQTLASASMPLAALAAAAALAMAAVGAARRRR